MTQPPILAKKPAQKVKMNTRRRLRAVQRKQLEAAAAMAKLVRVDKRAARDAGKLDEALRGCADR
jgi:hypothetical protein